MRRALLLLSLIVSLLLTNSALSQAIPVDDAAQVFQTAKRVSDRDGGKLWGIPVCGPMFFVDRATHFLVANQADGEGKLKQSSNVWTGQLPAEINPANSAIDWAGVRWTMLIWPVTSAPRDRERLLAHECFHRIQPALKLAASDVVNPHLDSKDGRIWLQLEWRALQRALVTTNQERRAAIHDALLFRNYRRSFFKNAADHENLLEVNEGLAEYTGQALANPEEADRRAAAVAALETAPGKRSFGRSFAYASGPAYGILLDATGVPWRKNLTPAADLGALLAVACKMSLNVTNESVSAAAQSYNSDSLMVFESERARQLEAKLALLRKRFVEGPVLILPAKKDFSYGFDPNDTVSLDDDSTVYGSARITDEWGTLETEAGALIVRKNGNIVRVAVSAPPNAATLVTDAWKLTLKPGWSLGSGARAHDFVVVQDDASASQK